MIQTLFYWATGIAAVLLIWYLTGFLPGRPIKRKNNRWHAWGPGDQVWGYINGDKKRFLPASMPLGFHEVYYPLIYNKDVEDGNLSGGNDTSADGKPILFYKAEHHNGWDKPIRKVREIITRLRKKEKHPYAVTADLPLSGFTFYLNFQTVIDVIEPMDTLKLEDFLVHVGDELNDAVYAWPAEQEAGWLENINDPDKRADVVIEKMIALRIDDDSIKINNISLKEYMNSKISFLGLSMSELSLDVGFDDKVQGILDARNKTKQQKEKTKLEVEVSGTRDIEREREKKDRDQDRILDKEYQDDVQIPLIQKLMEFEKEKNGAWKPGVTLFLGDQQDSSKTTNALLAKRLNETVKQKGGGSEN